MRSGVFDQLIPPDRRRYFPLGTAYKILLFLLRTREKIILLDSCSNFENSVVFPRPRRDVKPQIFFLFFDRVMPSKSLIIAGLHFMCRSP